MDKIVPALIAAFVSILGVIVNILVFRLEKKKFFTNLKFEQEKFNWQKETFLLDKEHEVQKSVKTDLFKSKIDSYKKILQHITSINDFLRKLFSETNVVFNKRSGEVSSKWLADYKVKITDEFSQNFENRIKLVLEINQEHNIHFPQSIHEYLKQYWYPNIYRLSRGLERKIAREIDNLIDAKQADKGSETNGLHNGETFLSNVHTLIDKTISLNRDLKEQLLRDIQ